MSVTLATKLDQSQTFADNSFRVPTTKLGTAQSYVLQVKELQKTRSAKKFLVKLALGNKKKSDKPTAGMLKAIGVEHTPRVVCEVRVKDMPYEVPVEKPRTLVMTDLFQVGQYVDVTGVSKGKGFQGGVKRHGFAGGPKTHGQSDRWRAPGSAGTTSTGSNTKPGQHMAGRMGAVKSTVKRLKVIEVGQDFIIVAGLVPGIRNGLLVIRKSA